MKIIDTKKHIVKLLSALLILLFIMAMAYSWNKSSQYHFDNDVSREQISTINM